jgi:hypothetical protein
MLAFVARCKDLKDAEKTQRDLTREIPNLVFTRVLRRASDLDAFKADYLLLEEVKGPDYDKAVRAFEWWPILGIGLLGAAVVLGTRVLSESAPSHRELAMVCGAIIAGLVLFAAVLSRAFRRIVPGRSAITKARNWLRRGRPIVFAVSEDAPDNLRSLPRGVVAFETYAPRSRSWRERRGTAFANSNIHDDTIPGTARLGADS